MDLLNWITQACSSLTSTVSPSVDAMGVHICVALATIMLVWFGVQEALASAQGGQGFNMGKFLSFFMLITFAYTMVKFYDSSIPGIGYSLKGFINGGAQYLVTQIGTDSATNILNTLQQAQTNEGPGMMSTVANPYNAIIYALIQVLIAGLSALISVIIAYMSAQQLRGLGADIYVVDLVAIGVLRELGVLLTSIIVAGRSGSAYAAELGSMKLNEEVDALTATGVDPFEVLVVPRLLGLAIALPLLTIVADLVGLAGGALLCRYLLDMPLTQFVGRVNYAISPSTFWVGLVKAPVFAVLIGLCGCYRGMLVRDSARELGRLVTVAVVQAIFLVILADALFAVLFMKMDI